MALNRLFASLTLGPTASVISRKTVQVTAVRYASMPKPEKPKPGFGIAYRRVVHFPEEYTVKPLDVTNLAGRDPVSGKLFN